MASYKYLLTKERNVVTVSVVTSVSDMVGKACEGDWEYRTDRVGSTSKILSNSSLRPRTRS